MYIYTSMTVSIGGRTTKKHNASGWPNLLSALVSYCNKKGLHTERMRRSRKPFVRHQKLLATTPAEH